MTFLQPFHQATLETQGHYATLEKVLFTMDILVRYFKTALVSKHSLFFSFKDYKLMLYNSLNMLLIKTFVLGLRKGRRFLTSITAKQTLPLYMLLPLFYILVVV
jgi:hypothetical protein